MLDFKRQQDATGPYLETSLCGKSLLTAPQLNKGTAFTEEERHVFGLLGKLPPRIETLEEQVTRAYLQFQSYTSRLQQYIYLNNLHDKNQILFYKLLSMHLIEMLPIVYTPIIGTAVKSFSREYRQPRGLYLAHTDQAYLDEILDNRSNPDIDLIVITDGEGVLGIGDQGIGGMDIPVAKLMVYSVCGGIDPTRTLPIVLDVGTNNETLLADPLYLGCRHARIAQADYDTFIERVVRAIQKHFPQAFLHWEDLGRDNARRVLDHYQPQLCTFNDDIQGTGAVTLAAVLAGCHVTHTPLTEQRIVVFGAGSAGTGICDQLVDAMQQQGLSAEAAYERFWLIDRQGLLLKNDTTLTPAQQPYACDPWPDAPRHPSLLETIQAIHPTLLIGCSAQPGAFTEEVIKTLYQHCPRPLIFPLSNPDENCEANPADLLQWTDCQALIATGTAFEPVACQGHVIPIAQCNNALVFPGIGLGVLAVRARRLSKGMIWAAAKALSQFSPSHRDPKQPLLPSLNEAKQVATHIAIAVAQCALEEGLATEAPTTDLDAWIHAQVWEPYYLPFRPSK